MKSRQRVAKEVILNAAFLLLLSFVILLFEKERVNSVKNSWKTKILFQLPTISKNETPSTTDEHLRPCRVVVKNEWDFHHEVIESTVLRFPLPWHEFNNCTTSKPVIYDFILYDRKYRVKPGRGTAGWTKTAKTIEETEFWGWKNYFEHDLQHKVFLRKDGSNTTTTRALFHEIISLEPQTSESPIDAIIDVTCDANQSFHRWLQGGKHRFCVLHGVARDHAPSMKQSCFLTPQYPEHQCTFFAADLPRFDTAIQADNDNGDDSSTEIKICAFGAKLDVPLQVFSKIAHQEYNATLNIFGRFDNASLQKAWPSTTMFGGINATLIAEKEFKRYYEKVSSCDIAMVLRDPLGSPKYYPPAKKSSGIIPYLIAYGIPAIMHTEFASIYNDALRAPVALYNDTLESKVEALKKLLVVVHDAKKD